MVTANEVFFPASPVDPKYFVDREEVGTLKKVINDIKAIPIIYGSSGIGKTSLVDYVCKKEWTKKLIVKVQINLDSTLATIRNEVYREVKGQYESSEKERRIGGRFSFFEAGGSKRERLVESNPVNDLSELMKDGILILDNLELAGEVLQSQLLSLVTTFADKPDTNLILIGIAENYNELFGLTLEEPKYQAMSRRWREIMISPLSYSKTSLILENGFEVLTIKISKKLCNFISELTLGDLSLIHEFGLIYANLAKKHKVIEISQPIFTEGLRVISSEWSNLYKNKFEKVRSIIDVPLNEYLAILFVVAFHSKDSMRIHEVNAKIDKIFDKKLDEPSFTLLQNERQLRINEFNQVSYIDPRYRLYVRLVCRLEFPEHYKNLSEFIFDVTEEDETELTHKERLDLLRSLFKDEKDEESRYLYKILVLGDSGVGKTSFRRTLINENFKTEYLSTIGADFASYDWKDGNLNVQLSLWDTAGHSSFQNIRSSFYRGAAGAVLCFDLTRKETFDNLDNWIKEYNRFTEYSSNRGRPMVIVGCKSDYQNRIDEQDIITYCKNLKAKYNLSYPVDYVPTSAHNRESVVAAINSLIVSVLLDAKSNVIEFEN